MLICMRCQFCIYWPKGICITVHVYNWGLLTNVKRGYSFLRIPAQRFPKLSYRGQTLLHQGHRLNEKSQLRQTGQRLSETLQMRVLEQCWKHPICFCDQLADYSFPITSSWYSFLISRPFELSSATMRNNVMTIFKQMCPGILQSHMYLFQFANLCNFYCDLWEVLAIIFWINILCHIQTLIKFDPKILQISNLSHRGNYKVMMVDSVEVNDN